MDSKQKHAELKKLGKKARTNLFDMLKLASEIADDPEYCEEYGGQTALVEHLEATGFAHFGGKPSLANMLRAYRKNPTKATWDEYSHNIWAMIDLSAPAKNTEAKEKINWKAHAKELEVKVEILEAELAELRTRHDQTLTKLGRAGRVAELV
jgi:hypothetical protein